MLSPFPYGKEREDEDLFFLGNLRKRTRILSIQENHIPNGAWILKSYLRNMKLKKKMWDIRQNNKYRKECRKHAKGYSMDICCSLSFRLHWKLTRLSALDVILTQKPFLLWEVNLGINTYLGGAWVMCKWQPLWWCLLCCASHLFVSSFPFMPLGSQRLFPRRLTLWKRHF